MARPADRRTICYWSQDDGCYVAEDVSVPFVCGTGATKEEAVQDFNELVIDLGDDPPPPGAVPVSRLPLHETIGHKTYERLNLIAARLGCTRGEVIDYLAFVERFVVIPEKPAE